MIAKTVDDESVVFSYHSLMGIVLGFLIVLRLAWGFVGTQNARFLNFALKPVELVSYLKGILKGIKKTWAGHNPASSWAAIVMMLMGLGLATSGYLMTSGKKTEFLEELHEICGNIFLVTAILHVLGIFIHTIRHKDLIGLSMIDGKKSDVPQTGVIKSSQPLAALIFVALVVAFSLRLLNSFDANARTVELLGRTLKIGEVEKKGREQDKEKVDDVGESAEHENEQRSDRD